MFGQTNVIEPLQVDSQTLNPGTYAQTIVHNGLLYFTADDSVHGEEIWTFDGTLNSLKMLKDVNPERDSQARFISNELEDYMLFTAYYNKEGDFGLWSTNGTEEGTKLLQKMNYKLGSNISDYVQAGTNFIKHGDKIYFVASLSQLTKYDIWETDGTPEGTKIWKNLDSVYNFSSSVLTKVGDNLLIWFNGTGSLTYQGIFEVDTKNSKLIKLVNAKFNQLASNNEEYYYIKNDKLYFTKEKSESTNHLWETDGTPQGTYRITKDIDSLKIDISSRMFFGNKTLFNASQGINKAELWISDETNEGTFSLTNHLDGFDYLGFSSELLKGKVVFTGSRGNIFEIWITDGTKEGTTLVSQINKGDSDFLFILSNEKPDNDRIFFSLYGVNNKYKDIWVTDGTKENTTKLIDLNISFYNKLKYRSDGNKLYFTNELNQTGEELWVTDGTIEGTQFVKELREGTDSSDISFPSRVINGRGFVKARTDKTNYSLILTGDPQSVSVRICNAMSESKGYTRIQQLTENKAIFIEKSSSDTNRIWITDYTFKGTNLLIPLDATNNNQANGLIAYFQYNDNIYFFADYYGEGQQLYRIPNTITSVEESEQTELMTVYPNPAKDFIQIEVTKPMQLSIVNTTGKKVKEYGTVENGKLNVAELHSGVYFVVDEQGKNIAKFVKE
jgi:ELWxxDGT repeat protein